MGTIAIAAESFGYIQKGGFCANITTDGGVAQGDSLVMDGGGTVGKVADTMADGEEECVFGNALAADASTTLSEARINCA